jgi:hypothetical protein
MVFAILKKHLTFMFSICQDSRLLHIAKEGLVAAFTALEPWQTKVTHEDQLLQQCSITSKMNGILSNTSVKIPKLSNVLMQVQKLLECQ